MNTKVSVAVIKSHSLDTCNSICLSKGRECMDGARGLTLKGNNCVYRLRPCLLRYVVVCRL